MLTVPLTRFAPHILAALLAGCSAVDQAVLGDPVREEARTPRSITYCFSPQRSSFGDVTQRAQAHCQTVGMHARKSGDGNCQAASWSPARIWERATFDCVQ